MSRQDTIAEIDKMLKVKYLDMIKEIIKDRTANTLFGQVEKTTKDVYGNKILANGVESKIEPLMIEICIPEQVVEMMEKGGYAKGDGLLFYTIDQALMNVDKLCNMWLMKQCIKYPGEHLFDFILPDDLTIECLTDWLLFTPTEDGCAVRQKPWGNYYFSIVFYGGITVQNRQATTIY